MASIELKIIGNTKNVYEEISKLENYAKNLKPIEMKFDIQGDAKLINAFARANNAAANYQKELNKANAAEEKKRQSAKQTAEAINYLNTTAAKYDATIKESVASSKRWSAALQSQIKAEQDERKATEGLASSYNGIDREIHKREAASKAFSQALRQQMREEQENAKQTAEAFNYINTPAAKYDATIKEAAESSKRFSAALQAQMQAEQDERRATEGLASSYNGIDREIHEREAASRAFSQALRKQMLEEQEARRATEGLASSYNVIDQAIHERETSSRAFSQALRQQMREEQENAKVVAGSNTNLASSVHKIGDAYSKLWSRITSTVTRRLINQAFTALRSTIKDTLDVMKDVDTQLINIQKVSGKTSEEIAGIGERAYDTAAQYGVAVEDYLSAVYSFQKAGLGESAESLAELATKTMLVGDTTAAVAEKFLISSNAAWELHGNIEELNKVIDQADYINNNYATTLDKIAAGLPIVASVAANAGMTYSETMAALGTIQSITQESGTKSATALRALILNIEKEAGTYLTEEGEEFEVTAESIKGLQGLLEKYAATEMEAARASGELLNPMTAIKALFEGMQNKDVTDIELFQLLSAMGGKLRTNQLTALVKNFDMFDEMLQRIGDSAGTADNEVELMMQSWEKKSQVLKDRWQQFIAQLVSTDTIKGLIDDITEFVVNLDPAAIGAAIRDTLYPILDFIKNVDWAGAAKHISEIFDKIMAVGKGTVIAATIGAVIGGLDKVFKLIKNISGLGLIKNTGTFFSLLASEGPSALALLGPTGGLVLGFGAILAGVIALGTALDEQGKKVKAYQELDDTLKDLNSQYDKLTGKGSELDTLREKGTDLTEVEKKRLDILEAQADALDDQIKKTTQLRYEAWQAAYGTGATSPVFEYDENGVRTGSHTGTKDQYDFTEIQHTIQLAKNEYGAGVIGADEYRSSLLGVVNAYSQIYDSLVEMRDSGMKLSDSQKGLIEYYEKLATAVEASDEAIRDAQNGEWTGARRGGDTYKDFQEYTAASEFWAVDVEQATASYQAVQDAIIQSAQETERQIQEITGNISNDINEWGVPQSVIESMSAVVTEANNVETAIEDIPDDKDVTLTPHFDEAIRKIQEYVGFLEHIKGTYTSTLTSTVYHEAYNRDAQGNLLPGFYDGSKYGGSGVIGGTKAAGGVSPGGPTLVNELGPELISENGRAYIAGGGRPAVVNLAPGAIVIPADETAEALKGGMPRYSKAFRGVDTPYYGDGPHGITAQGYVISMSNAISPGTATTPPPPPSYTPSGGSSSSSSSGSSAPVKVEVDFSSLEKTLADELKRIDAEAKLAENEGNWQHVTEMYEAAQEEIKKLVDQYRAEGYAEDSIEILTLLNKNYDYANKQLKLYQDKWDDLVDALQADTDATKALQELEEKRAALEEAVTAYENAQRQRTVRIFNAETGQWEWIADQKKIDAAQQRIDSAQEAYDDAVKKQAIEELKRMGENISDLSDIVLGPALSAVVTMSEDSEEFQNFAAALNAVFGVGSFLQSTEGTTSAISTVDSHDTHYSFGGVDITPEQAGSMTLAQLAQMLQVLNIT